uniref:Uncharacterized protein n=1 Tax=Arundo donax TaxID=35708 RepID=A0A0A9GDT4_ARUDO
MCVVDDRFIEYCLIYHFRLKLRFFWEM